MKHIAITGANRGIGLELVRQYAARPDTHVYALCRTPAEATELANIGSAEGSLIHVLACEMTDDASIKRAAAAIAKATGSLDLLINNAAINPPGKTQTLDTVTSESMLHVLRINTVAPLLLVQALLGLLKQGSYPKVINMSSDMGSLDEREYGGWYGYCTSKAALNMVTRGLAADLADDGIVTISLDPGWVKTEMGGRDADLTPAESANGVLRVIDGLTAADNGAYLRWNGRSLAW